jgi:hypothetical protein
VPGCLLPAASFFLPASLSYQYTYLPFYLSTCLPVCRYTRLANWEYVLEAARAQDPTLPLIPVIGNG